MSAQNYSLLLPYRDQGHIRVNRAAYVELEVLLYHNRIVKYHSYTDLENTHRQTATLDPCGKPTRLTAKAMNRALEQLDFAGEVHLDRGILYFKGAPGHKVPLSAPLTITKYGEIVDTLVAPATPYALLEAEAAR